MTLPGAVVVVEYDPTWPATFERLAALYTQRFAKTARLTQELQGDISDLQFTSRYRVPFQFSAYVRRHFNAGSFVESTAGRTVPGPKIRPFAAA